MFLEFQGSSFDRHPKYPRKAKPSIGTEKKCIKILDSGAEILDLLKMRVW